METNRIPSSRNTVKVEFSQTIPPVQKSPDKVLVSDALKHHVFLSTLEIDESGESKGSSREIDESSAMKPIEHDFNMLKIDISSHTGDTQGNQRITSPIAKPSFQKQSHDIHLLIQQYFQFIRDSIIEYINQNDISLDYSNYEESSEEGKTTSSKTPVVSTVLYLVDAHWYLDWETTVSSESNTSQLAFLGPICNDDLVYERVKSAPEPSTLSISSITSHEHHLRQDIVEGTDYVLVPCEVWTALTSWYGGGDVAIARKGYITMDTSIPENDMYPALSQASEAEGASINHPLHISTDKVISYIPGSKLIMDLYPCQSTSPEKERMIYHDMISYRHTPMTSPSRPNNATSPSNPTSPSKLPSGKSPLAAVKYIFDDVGHISPGCNVRCFVCHQASKSRCIKCSSVNYCSQTCQKAHWKNHKHWCGIASSHKQLLPHQFHQTLISSIGRRGKVGLLNLGNSCYMNSSLQCLSHITPLIGHILSERYIAEINKENRDGTGGNIASELHDLFKELWLENKSTMSPVGIKRILGRTNPDYAGVQQHDAHEVTMLLLDKLHEDLNRVLKKPYTTCSEGDGSNDEVIFQEAWTKHLLRENSAVLDLIGGAVRNEINCRVCKKTVVKFDSQHAVQLAIPKNNMRTIYVAYIPINHDPKLTSYSHGHVGDMIEIITAKLLTVSIDKHATIKQIKIHLMTSFASSITAAKDVDVTIDNMMMFTVDKQSNLLSKYLDDNDSIKTSLLADDYLALYMISSKMKMEPTLRSYIVLMQRKFTPAKMMNQTHGMHNYDNHMTIEPIGLPMLLSIQNTWTCHRVRMMLFQQIERYLHPASIIGKLYHQYIAELGLIKAQLKLAKYLPIRVVNDRGRGLYIPLFDKMASHDHDDDDELIAKLPEDRQRIYGSWLPADNSLNLVNVLFGDSIDNDIIFLSVDWSHAWLQALNEDETDKVIISSATHTALQSNLINNQVITATSYHSSSVKKPSTIHVARISDLSFAPSRSNTNANTISLEQCLREHSKMEVLENGNEWYCSNCKTHQKATKQVTFWRGKLPEVLILSLKRFEFRGSSDSLQSSPMTGRYNAMFGNSSGGHREKIEDFVDFPLEGLDLSPFCHNMTWSTTPGQSTQSYDNLSELSNGSGSSNHHNQTTKKPSAIYDLFAICNHYGRMGFGHYTAFARDYVDDQLSPQWYSFDDDVVRACASPEDVKTRAAYMLFYRRRPNT